MNERPVVGAETDAMRQFMANGQARVNTRFRHPGPQSPAGFPLAAGMSQQDAERLHLENRLRHDGKYHARIFDLLDAEQLKAYEEVMNRITIGRIALKRREHFMAAPDGTTIKVLLEWIDEIVANEARPVPVPAERK